MNICCGGGGGGEAVVVHCVVVTMGVLADMAAAPLEHAECVTLCPPPPRPCGTLRRVGAGGGLPHPQAPGAGGLWVPCVPGPSNGEAPPTRPSRSTGHGTRGRTFMDPRGPKRGGGGRSGGGVMRGT